MSHLVEDVLKAIIRAHRAAAYASRVPGLMDAIEAVLLAKDFKGRGFREAVSRMDALIEAAHTDVKIRAGLRHPYH
jgi:hypothetical protein